MANFLESRDWSAGAALPASVARVACIGDSMTYGGGVMPREALPAALIEALNGAFLDHLIWVDNLGKNGANLWHSWKALRDRIDLGQVRYDAVLFSVCQNDAQIFDMHQVGYNTRDYTETWQAGSATFDAAEAVIADFGAFCRQRGIAAILYFYSRTAADIPIIAIVGQMAARHDVHFVDMYAFLTEGVAISILEYRASPFDGHPSGNAHRLSARHLAAELRKQTPFGAVPAIAGDISAAVAEAVEAMSADIGGDVLMAWTDRVLAAKERNIRRRAEASSLVIGDLATARQRIETVYRRWRLAHDRAQASRRLESRQEDYWPPAKNLDEWIIKLEELTYCIGHYAGGPLGDRVADILAGNAYLAREKRLRPPPVGWREELTSAIDTARDERARIIDLAAGPGEPIPMARAHLALIDRLMELLADLLAAPASAVDAAPDTPAGRLVQLTNLAIDSAFHYIPQNRHRLLEGIDLYSRNPAAFTRVEVTVEGDQVAGLSEDRTTVFVDVDYETPPRPRHTTRYDAGVAHERYLHAYEMPLLLAGSVAIRLGAWDAQKKRFLDGHTRFTRVEVFNVNAAGALCGQRRRVWERQDGVNVDEIILADVRLD